MNAMNSHGVVAAARDGNASGRLRGLVATGLVAAVLAMAATTVAAALSRAVGVDFELPDGGETMPLSGIAVMTGIFSVVGIGIAAALRRWSTRPTTRFVRVAIALTAISLVPPFLTGANAATVAALLLLHLVAAAVMIPALARGLPVEPTTIHATERNQPHEHRDR